MKTNLLKSFFLLFLVLAVVSGCKKDSSTTPNTITDVDGNVYHTVTIGSQTWLVENLKTTHFNDNTAIPNVTSTVIRDTTTKPGYFWYNDDITNKAIYGALYNWYAVNTGKLAPKGWHVATNDEWSILLTYLGGVNAAGKHLKEIGSAHWNTDNNGEADNSSGFTALPGGYSNLDGNFGNIGLYGYWWTATSTDSHDAFSLDMFPGSTGVGSIEWSGDNWGCSVRCVKN